MRQSSLLERPVENEDYLAGTSQNPKKLVGVGHDMEAITIAMGQIYSHWHFPASRETFAEKFYRLAEQWKSEMTFSSSVTEMAMHPAYQQIIGMGERAIPLILIELSREPDHWFWALKAISGIDPVPPEYRGDMGKMRELWLAWGHSEEVL